MKIVQCTLSHGLTQTQVCWLDWRPELKKGVYVTLKDSEDPLVLWRVDSVGEPWDGKPQSMKQRSESWFAHDHRRKIPSRSR